jgi:hypothetical protein
MRFREYSAPSYLCLLLDLRGQIGEVVTSHSTSVGVVTGPRTSSLGTQDSQLYCVHDLVQRRLCKRIGGHYHEGGDPALVYPRGRAIDNERAPRSQTVRR